jgi:hypothetical protein
LRKLNSTLVNNQWIKEEITRGTRKYFETNEDQNFSVKADVYSYKKNKNKNKKTKTRVLRMQLSVTQYA